MNGRVIGVIAIKGGVGKTTTVTNLAAALANEFGKKVLVVDANFTAPNLGLHLGIVNSQYTLHDILANKADVPKAIQKHEFGFDIIPGALVPKHKIDPFSLKRKINHLRYRYDVILIDSSPTLNEEMLATMVAADELLVVSSPDYPTLSCTMRAVKVAKLKKTPITGIILNKVRKKSYELSAEDIEQAAETPIISIIPDEDKVLEALSMTKPAVLHAPNKNMAVEYKKLAGCLIGEDYKDKRLWPKIRNFFITQDIKKEDLNRTLAKK